MLEAGMGVVHSRLCTQIPNRRDLGRICGLCRGSVAEGCKRLFCVIPDDGIAGRVANLGHVADGDADGYPLFGRWLVDAPAGRAEEFMRWRVSDTGRLVLVVERQFVILPCEPLREPEGLCP
jgi:hypothetical protein